MDKLKQGYRWTELCKERTGMTPREFEKQYQTKWTPEITLIPTSKLEEMQSQLQAAKERIKELEQALSEEIEICPSAKANNEEYCFRAKVCSICSNNRYIKELLSPQPKGE